MKREEIVNWSKKYFEENGKISRLNIIDMRPDDNTCFSKSPYAPQHIIIPKRRLEKSRVNSFFEGSRIFAPLYSCSKYDESTLKKLKNKMDKVDNRYDLTIAFAKNPDDVSDLKCCIFTSEKIM